MIAFDVPVPAAEDAAGAGEAIVVVAETREPAERFDELEEQVEGSVLEATGAAIDHVVLVPPGTVLKTSSGKLRRRETRELYLDGKLRRAKEPPWVLAGIALASGWARARASLTRAGSWLYSLYASAVVAGFAGCVLFCVALVSRSREGAWRFARRGLRLVFKVAGIPVRRLGPPCLPRARRW